MKQKSIIIIGAGLGGLAAGIYGQLNDYRTDVFEMHSLPGGQCTAWQRKGYTFDACIHHLFGCAPASVLYGLWQEIGAVPREFVPLQDCVSVLSPDGKLFRDFYDTGLLESHMNELAPNDHKVIRDYIAGIRAFTGSDVMGKMMLGSKLDLVRILPDYLRYRRWFAPTMARFGERFSDPFLRRAMPLLVYANPEVPLFIHLVRHAYGLTGALQWPVGGALELSKSVEQRYRKLGGTPHYRSKVTKILTRDGKANGIVLEDGTEHHADIVISNADGRRTIMELLEGRFADDAVRAECTLMDDTMPFAVQVFLGVNRNLSKEPSSMILLHERPVTLAGHASHELELQTYGFDSSMAPSGKGVIKVELTSQYSYWKELASDKQRYTEAKQELADHVISLLDERYFAGLRGQVEVVDVSTLITWERFTGGTMGLGIYPTRKQSFVGTMLGAGQGVTLPGLSDFYFAGTWSTSAGALFMNALSGKNVIKRICRRDGRRFTAR